MTTVRTIREPDRAQIGSFVNALFCYADENSFVSLRAFDQFDSTKGPVLIEGVEINGGGLGAVTERATLAAKRAANTPSPSVFAPPIATFTNPKKASEADLANGVAISVELDSGNSTLARQRLEGILGPATAVVASGGDWSDPNTGEVTPKLHLHWRLSEPTRTPDEHGQLKQARRLACLLVGADPSAKPAVHPLRWPGSWHLKGRPRLASILAIDPKSEVHLAEAIDALQAAIEAAGMQDVGLPASSGDPQAPTELVESALTAIPNTDVHYSDWVRVGYAVFGATGGSPEGFQAWSAWSAKSSKHCDRETTATWRKIAAAPPNKIGAGTIFWLAKAAGWQRPSAKPDPTLEPEPEPEPEPDGRDDAEANANKDALPTPDLSILRLRRREPAKIPLDVFGSRWEAWINAAAEASSAPPDYVAAALLACSSTLIGNARWAQASPGWEEPPHLWCAGVGDSGDGKSPGSDPIMKSVISALEQRMAAASDFVQRFNKHRLASEVAKAEREIWEKDVREARKKGNPPPSLSAEAADPGPEPKEPCIVMHDITIEEVAHQLAFTVPKGLLMARDELSGWLLGMTSYNDGAREFWIEAYGGRSFRVARRKHPKPICVHHLAVGWFGGIQPDKLTHLLGKPDDGLLARFTWFWPDPVPFDFSLTVPDIAWATEALDKVSGLQMETPTTPEDHAKPRYVPLDNDAKPLMRQFAREMQQRKETAAGLIRSTYGKARGLALRLSLILEYLWWCADLASWQPGNSEGESTPPSEPRVISAKAFMAAATLVDTYLIPMAERVFGDVAVSLEDRRAATLAKWIVGERATEVHVRHLHREVRLADLKESEDIDATAKRLVEAGFLLPPLPGGHRQKPRKAYPVNPRLWEALP